MKIIKFAWQISRPRFWIYLAGTYLIGFTAGVSTLSQFSEPMFWINLLFFLIPANIFLYGVNDLFDTDTDVHNLKKVTHEHLLKITELKTLKKLLLITLGIFFAVYFSEPNMNLKLYLLCFLILSYLYSASPVRLKARPLLDFSSNILYAIPGFLGFYQSSGILIPPAAGLAAFFWVCAMHLFSAIPDIKSDRTAGVTTSAVFLGARKSLVLCSGFWLFFCLIIWAYAFLTPWCYLLIIYPVIPIIVLLDKKTNAGKVYWMFPYLNGIAGFITYFLLSVSLLNG